MKDSGNKKTKGKKAAMKDLEVKKVKGGVGAEDPKGGFDSKLNPQPDPPMNAFPKVEPIRTIPSGFPKIDSGRFDKH
jgi:hypothetical protein